MPYDLHIVKPSDFIRLDAHKQVDVKQSLAALSALAKTCVQRNVDHALLDVRDLPATLSLTDLYTLAKAFPETGFTQHHRLAILHRFSSAERAEMFAMFASDHGWQVRAFENYEEAIEWFSVDTPLGE
ncbi:MAG TPA: hypothetical protein VHS31_10275 [Tepidisphaeraceae bacterium]|jgi:hypothetical protein|nr:hypothetical protein [Tepidisphaeraceae bacterium]